MKLSYKITLEIEAPMDSLTSIKPCVNKPGMQGFNGAAIDILAATRQMGNYKDLPGEPEIFYIKGNAVYVIEMLEEMLRAAKNLQADLVENLGPLRPTDCPSCVAEERYANGSHTQECPLAAASLE